MLYVKTTICLGVAALLTTCTEVGVIVHAADEHAAHTPFYGAVGFAASVLIVATLAVAILGVIHGRQPALTPPRPPEPAPVAVPQPRKPSPRPRPRPTIELRGDVDNASTIPIGAQRAVARVPSPRPRPTPQVYHCDTEAPRIPATVEMKPARPVEMMPVREAREQMAKLMEIVGRQAFDRGVGAAAGFVPPDEEDRSAN